MFILHTYHWNQNRLSFFLSNSSWYQTKAKRETSSFLISLFTFISFILLKKSYCMFVVAMEFYLNNFSNFYCSNLIDFPFTRNQTIQSDKEDSLRKDL